MRSKAHTTEELTGDSPTESKLALARHLSTTAMRRTHQALWVASGAAVAITAEGITGAPMAVILATGAIGVSACGYGYERNGEAIAYSVDAAEINNAQIQLERDTKYESWRQQELDSSPRITVSSSMPRVVIGYADGTKIELTQKT